MLRRRVEELCGPRDFGELSRAAGRLNEELMLRTLTMIGILIAIALPLIWKLRTKPLFARRWTPACSACVAALGGFWFVQRVWF